MGGKSLRAVARALRGALPLLLILGVVGSSVLTSANQAGASAAAQSAAPEPRSSYVVTLGEPPTLAVGQDRIADLAARAREQVKTDLAEQLAALADAEAAGPGSFDATVDGFRVDLTEHARARLAVSPLVGEVHAADSAPPAIPDEQSNQPLPPRPASATRSAQVIGSVNFIQVNSPFMWGRTNIGGLSVELTLENSSGQVKGVASQTLNAPPNDHVKIDRTQLYYETLFKDPNAPGNPLVTILPGDRVRVVTTGVDPGTGASAVEDKRIVVDDVQAWTSYENDTVSGIAPPGSDVFVTVATSPSIAEYATPGSRVTFRETTADSAGNFSVNQFRTSSSETLKTVELTQGSTGFVRVQHSDGNEVYTYHGQNIFVLQNSEIVHGYAFPLPSSPSQLETGVALLHPLPPVTVTLSNSGGSPKDSGTDGGSLFPYQVFFQNALVSAGDLVDVSIWGAPPRRVTVGLIDAAVDVGANQISGTAPPNTALTVQAGRIAGYISASSYFDFIVNRVTTDGSGRFSSGAFGCGTNGSLRLEPGSFGYVGYEDARANFVYEAVAAPTVHVMSDYPFVEGWLANGALRPTLAVRGESGASKHSSTVRPIAIWMVSQRLFVNVYFNQTTSEFVVPNDVVTLTGPTGTATVPVDRINAYINVDNDTIFGDAPAGATLRAIPENDRWSYRVTTADQTNRFSAGNPFRNVSSHNCSEQDKTEDFDKADSGRVYYRHPDGNAVFAHYGRVMWVNQNEQYVDVWPFVWRDVDWDGTPGKRAVTVTLTRRDGSAPITTGVQSEPNHPGAAKIAFVDAQGQRVLIRAGDSVTASFLEGPDDGPQRLATLTLDRQPLVLGVPDVDSSTIAGIAARGWHGGATMSINSTTDYSAPIVGGSLTAWGPNRFADRLGKAVTIARGYSGTVGVSTPSGVRLWSAWAPVALPTKIVGYLNPGDTRVCGTAAPNASLRIHDMSAEGQDVILGSGTVDSNGNFCATVAPLVKDQVILAVADGTYSQPVVVGALKRIFVTFAPRGARTTG